MGIKKRKISAIDAPLQGRPSKIFEHGVSPTGLLAFHDCRLKRKLAIQGWQTKSFANAMNFGKFGHGIFEQAYIELDALKTKAEKRKFVKNTKRLRKIVDEYMDEFEASEDWTMADERYRASYELWSAQMYALLPAYFAFYAEKEFAWKWYATEMKIEGVKFGETKLNGYLDYLHQNKKQLIIMDNKFMGRISEDVLIKTLDYDFQMYFYGYAVQRIFGILPEKAVYNVIRRPSIKLNKNETLTQHTERLRVAINKDPAHYFKRFNIAFDKVMMKRFETDLEKLVAEYTRWIKDGTPFNLFGNPCNGKYGVCHYYDLCHYNTKASYIKKLRKG